MIFRNWILFLMSLSIFAACGQVTDPKLAVELDDKELSAAEKLYCEEGQRLLEDRTALNVTFDKLRSKSDIFAFANGSGTCALQSDIDNSWPNEEDPLFFKMKLNQKCLPNNSIWIASVVSLSTEQKYVFRRVGKPTSPVIEMTGSNHLSGSYVAGVTGLRVLICQ